MLFCACRAGDILNAFVGLWLVPKYVGPTELGAVMPLSTFASFLALPVSIFAMTFMKEMTALATNGEYGKMKSLMRSVFIGAGIFLVLSIVITHLTFPAFLKRIRVAEGSLGLLILTAAFSGAVAPLYQNALQALKRFKTISFLSIIGAPIRFVAMIATMPFRALSGYFVGQSATPVFIIGASIWSLRKELSVRAEPYWTKPTLRRFSTLLLGIAAYHYAANILGLVDQTVLRQRIPEIDSAAYYMATRFSDIAGFLTATLLTVLFPFTATLASEGKPTRPLVIKSAFAILIVSFILATVFLFFGRMVLSSLPDGDKYINFSWAIPWLIGIHALVAIPTFYANTEISAGRFNFLKWWIPLHVIFAAFVLLLTGYGYFTRFLPTKLCDFLAANNLTSLSAMLLWFTVTSTVKLAFTFFELLRQK